MASAELFIKYLVFKKRLHLPGIGKFTIERWPARLDFAEKQLHPPVESIMFTHEHVAVDKDFYSYAATEQQITDVEAIASFNAFITDIHEQLKQRNVAVIPGIGNLKKEYTDTYTFQPAYEVSNYLPVLPAERITNRNHVPVAAADEEPNGTYLRTTNPANVIDDELEEERVHNDYWWIYALVIFLLGIVALVWYYLENGRLTV